MAVPDSASRSPSWRSSLTVSEESDLERRILPFLASGAGSQRLIAVTDLVDPRIAFFRSAHPVPVPEEVAARREAGRAAHERVGRSLAAPMHREVRVAFEGIHGRIDLLEEIPLELKWTRRLPDPARLLETRREYLEQLGMYCAILDQSRGRLLLLAGESAGPRRIEHFEIRFPGLPEIRSWMISEAARLRDAFDRRDPTGLRRCTWFGRSCEYREAGVCPCIGREEPRTAPVEGAEVRLLPSPTGLERALQAEPVDADPAADPVTGYSELLFPRFAYFGRIGAEKLPAEPFSPGESWRTLRDAVLQFEPQSVDDRWALAEEPTESVPCFRGEPYLVKTTRAGRPPVLRDLPDRQSHYFLDLGLRAAAIGVSGGWIFLAPERPSSEFPPCVVIRARFDPGAPWSALLHERLAGLHEALRARDPSRLPPCPDWRFERCPYRAICGDAAGRAQR